MPWDSTCKTGDISGINPANAPLSLRLDMMIFLQCYASYWDSETMEYMFLSSDDNKWWSISEYNRMYLQESFDFSTGERNERYEYGAALFALCKTHFESIVRNAPTLSLIEFTSECK